MITEELLKENEATQIEIYITTKLNKDFLTQKERDEILKWIKHYGLTKDEIIKAFEEKYNPKNKKNQAKVSFTHLQKIVENLLEKRKKEDIQKDIQGEKQELKTATKTEEIKRKDKQIELTDLGGEEEINNYWKSLPPEKKQKLINQARKELLSKEFIQKNINMDCAIKIKVRAKIRKEMLYLEKTSSKTQN